MKEIILEFLEWMPDNIDDIFELIDKPEEVVKKYIKETQKQLFFMCIVGCGLWDEVCALKVNKTILLKLTKRYRKHRKPTQLTTN